MLEHLKLRPAMRAADCLLLVCGSIRGQVNTATIVGSAMDVTSAGLSRELQFALKLRW